MNLNSNPKYSNGSLLEKESAGAILRSPYNEPIGDQMAISGKIKPGMVLGIAGMLISSAGALAGPSTLQKCLFLSGACLLISTSVIERHRLYIWLQAIVIAGTLAAFMPAGQWAKAAVPLCGGAIFAIASLPILRRNPNEILGAAGVLALSAGFAVSHPAVYLLGALLVSIYSLVEYRRGSKIALLWLILNSVFAATALVALAKGA